MKKGLPPVSVIFIAAAVIFSSCRNSRVTEIGIKENIHHDDFEYSVRSYLKTSCLSVQNDKPSEADSMYYLVRFRVENRAMRVNHKWDNSIAYVVDESGNKYENSIDKQILLDKSLHFGWKEDYMTPAGTSDSTILVFNLPAKVNKPYLKVRGETLMGDVLDRGRFRKIKVRLF